MKKNKKGFTLAELLIVVAIVGVLVAISIPIFHTQLRKARLAVNQANGRAAFSAAEAAYLEDLEKYGTAVSNSNTHGRFENYDTVTYTYFTEAGKGILNFHYSPGDNRWICDSRAEFIPIRMSRTGAWIPRSVTERKSAIGLPGSGPFI